MKVVIINGSPRKNGNTSAAVGLVSEELAKAGIDSEVLNIGGMEIRGCMACNYCKTSGTSMCVFTKDLVNAAAQSIAAADGFVLACPTYYAGIPGTMKSFLDRLFYSGGAGFRHKAAMAVVVARRSGGEDVFHQLHNYFHLAQVVVAPSQYWVVGHGLDKGELLRDAEGVQTIRGSAAGLAWVMKLIKSGAENGVNPPEREDRIYTNFVR